MIFRRCEGRGPNQYGAEGSEMGEGGKGGVLQQKPTFADLEYNFVDLL